MSFNSYVKLPEGKTFFLGQCVPHDVPQTLGSSLTYRIQAFNVISFRAEVVQCGPNDSGCCCGWFVQGAGEATDHGLLAKKGCSLNRGEWVNEMDKQRSWETHNLNKYGCIYYTHLSLSLSTKIYIYMHTDNHVMYVYLYTHDMYIYIYTDLYVCKYIYIYTWIPTCNVCMYVMQCHVM